MLTFQPKKKSMLTDVSKNSGGFVHSYLKSISQSYMPSFRTIHSISSMNISMASQNESIMVEFQKVKFTFLKKQRDGSGLDFSFPT